MKRRLSCQSHISHELWLVSILKRYTITCVTLQLWRAFAAKPLLGENQEAFSKIHFTVKPFKKVTIWHMKNASLTTNNATNLTAFCSKIAFAKVHIVKSILNY